MNQHRADPRYDEAHRRAADILRWLENSGPRYEEVQAIAKGWTKDGIILSVGDHARPYGPGEMSFASWCICQEFGAHGAILNLKLRTK